MVYKAVNLFSLFCVIIFKESKAILKLLVVLQVKSTKFINLVSHLKNSSAKLNLIIKLDTFHQLISGMQFEPFGYLISKYFARHSTLSGNIIKCHSCQKLDMYRLTIVGTYFNLFISLLFCTSLFITLLLCAYSCMLPFLPLYSFFLLYSMFFTTTILKLNSIP